MLKLTTRRRFIFAGTIVAAGALGLGHRHELGVPLGPNRDHPKHDLAASLVDTILPYDGRRGGLSSGMHKIFKLKISQEPRLAESCGRLFATLESYTLASHRDSFKLLDVDTREQILNSILQRQILPTVRTELTLLRKLLLNLYFSSEAGRKSIGFVLPSHYSAY